MLKQYHNKTILQLVPHATYSNIEISAKDIIDSLKKKGYAVIVVSASHSLQKYCDENQIKHYFIKINSGKPLDIIRNSFAIFKILKAEKVDLIHARSRGPAWSCFIAAKRACIPFITTFHAIYNYSTLGRRFYNSILARGEKIIAISQFSQEFIEKQYPDKIDRIVMIHRGIDASYFDQKNILENTRKRYIEEYCIKDMPVILVPASFVEWKGHMLLLNALHAIKELDFHCIFIGDLSKKLDYIESIRSKIIQLKLQSKIKLFSQISDIRALYAVSDIIISSSTQPEAFNRALVEAQAMEKIVIATNLGSATEIIKEGTGLLVNCSDAEDLSNKIRYVLENLHSKEMKLMAKKARKSVIKNYNIKTMVDQTDMIYQEILS